MNPCYPDLNEATGEVSDIAVSNNKDTRKILATVAATVYEFTNRYSGSLVLVRGSTASRTRLYRMRIFIQWKQINMDFEVLGFINGTWEPFVGERNYEAFLISRK